MWTPAIRWASQVNTSLRPGGGLDDDIVILDPPRTIRPLQTKGVAPARRTKAKPAAVSSSTHQSYPAREGLAGVSQTVNQQITKTLKLQPLSETSVATPVQSVTAATSIDVGDVKGGLAGVAASFNDPKRLREAIIVSVILQPPVSLRGRNRRI